MIDKNGAAIIAGEYISKIQNGCPTEISINYDITEEYDLGFVFFYNSRDFWTNKYTINALAGNGPILVLRDSGELVVLPHYQSVEESLRDYGSKLPI